jgi:hypothetical protein
LSDSKNVGASAELLVNSFARKDSMQRKSPIGRKRLKKLLLVP